MGEIGLDKQLAGFTRRTVLACASIGAIAGSAIAAYGPDFIRTTESTTAGQLPPINTFAEPIISGTVLIDVAIENDVVVPVNTSTMANGVITQTIVNVAMQTNGCLLRIDLSQPAQTINPERIILEVTDLGHNEAGDTIERTRIITGRRLLFGPFPPNLAGPPIEPNRLLLILSDPLFRQDDRWQSRIQRIILQPGWMGAAAAAEIPGSVVRRADNRSYPPFPVQVATQPFQRIAPGQELVFEVTGLNDFGRDGRMFACAQAWLNGSGNNGSTITSSQMVASQASPSATSPSNLPVPVYQLRLNGDEIPEGPREVQYRLFPFIGPAWDSQIQGQPFPALSAPRGLPACNDKSSSWQPVFGLVAQSGIGLAGNDFSGLAFSIEAAKAAGRSYRSIGAMADALKQFNSTMVPVMLADGPAMRAFPHNDIAGGVAVLCPVPSSFLGSNFGAYAISTPMASQTAYPPGATCFEISSETGLPDPTIRLRGVSPNGVPLASSVKTVPSRLMLRGIWLDGIGLSGSAHAIIDGSAAGAPAIAPNTLQHVCLLTTDCRLQENPNAGSAAPARARAGFVYDVRLRHEGVTGSAAIGIVASHAGIALAIGGNYSRPVAGMRMPLTAVLGCKFTNIGVGDQLATAPLAAVGRLLLNCRFDYSVAFSSSIITLAFARPSVGGLGIANVFVRGTLYSGVPAIQISSDGSLHSVDNLIMRHVGHDLINQNRITDGRANILYQDQGAVRIDKYCSISFCAFKCYSVKGDDFPATRLAGSISTSWSSVVTYGQGALVHDSFGTATASSNFYQALRMISPTIQSYASLGDSTAWKSLGKIARSSFGVQAERQGNSILRYHVGCRGNVTASTGNGNRPPGRFSWLGFAWGPDESFNLTNEIAFFETFYISRAGNDYRPNPAGPLANRVQAGMGCLPFDLAGVTRRNFGGGAAGAYEG